MKRLWMTGWVVLGCGLAVWGQSVAAQSSEPGVGKPPAVSASPGPPQTARASDAGPEFVIGIGDLLAVNVWKEAEMSRVVPVRSDGRISLPLLGEMEAAGRTARQLEAEVRAKLKDYVSEPEVTVMVQEIRSQKFNVLGMVMRPGSYVLAQPTTVIDAIALSGGFRDFAKQKDVYVLRRRADGSQQRLGFNYKEVVKGQHSEQNIALKTGDTVVVP